MASAVKLQTDFSAAELRRLAAGTKNWSKGKPSRLSAEQQAQVAELVEWGPDRAVHGVVRWRRVDLQRVVAERFGSRPRWFDEPAR